MGIYKRYCQALHGCCIPPSLTHLVIPVSLCREAGEGGEEGQLQRRCGACGALSRNMNECGAVGHDRPGARHRLYMTGCAPVGEAGTDNKGEKLGM